MINAFYNNKFKDNLFVVKASGDLIEDDKALDSLIHNIKDLNMHGIKIMLVYGGGKATDRALDERGIAIQKQEGRRITDKATLDVMKEVIGGSLSLKIYEAMARHDMDGANLNAVPQAWVKVKLRNKKPVDYGYVGDIEDTDTRSIARVFRHVNFVAVPCLCWAEEGTLCNINADTIATHLAIGAGAHKLMFLSNVDGVEVKGQPAFIITSEDIQTLIDDGTVTGGMKVKMENCRLALEAGVRRIHLINGLRQNALYNEIFEPIGPGTMLFKAEERDAYMNEIEIQKAIGAKK